MKGIKHRLTRVRRPQTNGKVVRFRRRGAEEFYASNFFDIPTYVGRGDFTEVALLV